MSEKEKITERSKLLSDTIRKPILQSLMTLTVKVDLEKTMKESIEAVEREIIMRMMDLYHGNRIAVMDHLGISRTTMWRKSEKEYNVNE